MTRSRDIIGDVHGYAGALRTLLEGLGYRRHGLGYRHPDPDRRALFLGDYIDRGPEQEATLAIVRATRDAGDADALMGNHELNAIAYATERPQGGHYRPHSLGNESQHEAFLRAFRIGSKAYSDAIEFMRSLAICYRDEKIQAVHAAWIAVDIEFLKDFTQPDGVLLDEAFPDALQKSTLVGDILERLLKGPEHPLPRSLRYVDKDGIGRRRSRVRWWDPNPTTLNDALFLEGVQLPDGSEDELQNIQRFEQAPHGLTFFGHYWLKGHPAALTSTAACLDYSIAANGVLAAYSHRGETRLDPVNFSFAQRIGQEYEYVRPLEALAAQ